MPANNEEQVEAGIRNIMQAALLLVRAAKNADEAAKYDDAIGQNWGQLASAWPNFVADPGVDDTVLSPPKDAQGEGFTRQPFTDNQLNQAEKTVREIVDVFSGNTVKSESLPAGTDVVAITGIPTERLYELLREAV